jgi:hypothetical protein
VTTNTQLCVEAYAGAACRSCNEDGYFALNGRCFSCGDDKADQARIVLFTVVVALGGMMLLALFIATLEVGLLVKLIQMFVVLQGVAQVSVSGVKSVPVGKEALAIVATYCQ